MKKLRRCVLYRSAKRLQMKPNIEWVVCKDCQKKIKQGRLLDLLGRAELDYKESK